MKILLTGHEGCVGSSLGPYLENLGHTVIPFEGDIRDWDNWVNYIGTYWDVLIHLAAIPGVRKSFEIPEEYYDHNVNGTKNALSFSRHFAAKHLYASSSNAYEWYGNPYAATKKMCEVIASDHTNAKGMRFHTVWPGRDDMLYKKLERGEVEYINSNHSRDWIHIDDLCSAIVTILNNWAIIDKKVLDIGTGSTFSVLDMAQNVFGWTGDIRTLNPNGERVKTQADVQYLYDLGWKPEKDLYNESSHN